MFDQGADGLLVERNPNDVKLRLHVFKTDNLADTVRVTRALVGRTVAVVERDLILETLKHCLGNRTHAANILGISIRTLRNKLNEYATDGVPIPPPGGGDMRMAV
jgi:DNA-binding NtrC family response regulator